MPSDRTVCARCGSPASNSTAPSSRSRSARIRWSAEGWARARSSQSCPSASSPRSSQNSPSAQASRGPGVIVAGKGPFQRRAEIVLLTCQHRQITFPLGQSTNAAACRSRAASAPPAGPPRSTAPCPAAGTWSRPRPVRLSPATCQLAGRPPPAPRLVPAGADLGCLRQAEGTGEHRQLGQEPALPGVQQVVAPVDGRPQRLVPWVGGWPPVGQEAEPVGQGASISAADKVPSRAAASSIASGSPSSVRQIRSATATGATSPPGAPRCRPSLQEQAHRRGMRRSVRIGLLRRQVQRLHRAVHLPREAERLAAWWPAPAAQALRAAGLRPAPRTRRADARSYPGPAAAPPTTGQEQIVTVPATIGGASSQPPA